MEASFISLQSTPCWVYIAEKEKSAEGLQVGFCRSLPVMLERTGHDKLLYYRQFSTPTDALGHKLLLEELSGESLQLTISSINPEMRDLHNDFIISRSIAD
ncbi:hypothetical protein [Parabacteroides sp. PF5-6]|uniref:hypothetical protein n=1 Tax=Parabacteroides sp. PF5-6 TaxID=1742403 RepID=UPI0024064104|nr:hypothetical protein [Parabacteroides sp. PF5-6]MDF9828900.1 hypothetical protein [Parabacteroides sp. PF5-6]